MDKLKSLHSSKMFRNGKFVEIKGSELTFELKESFVNYLCKYNAFEVIYIDVDNSNVDEKLYRNKARAFNYLVDLCLGYSIRKKYYLKGII